MHPFHPGRPLDRVQVENSVQEAVRGGQQLGARPCRGDGVEWALGHRHSLTVLPATPPGACQQGPGNTHTTSTRNPLLLRWWYGPRERVPGLWIRRWEFGVMGAQDGGRRACSRFAATPSSFASCPVSETDAPTAQSPTTSQERHFLAFLPRTEQRVEPCPCSKFWCGRASLQIFPRILLRESPCRTTPCFPWARWASLVSGV
mmetsp:Transcript_4536/g.6256  ORF Transcript_4536/g.6256 Transcript_4536/m.6256 type:complete len:203 (+) Transcript_4536:825-1433(+)